MAKLGQIDLFTKRIRKPPPPPERALHIAVADSLRVGLAPGWVWCHIPNGELRADKTGALLKRMGVQPGWPDFLLIGPPHGRAHGLELKREGERPRASQLAVLAQIHAAGGEAAVADNYTAAIDILRMWGAISDRLHVG